MPRVPRAGLRLHGRLALSASSAHMMRKDFTFRDQDGGPGYPTLLYFFSP